MPLRKLPSESGQILVLIVGLIFGLIGVTALVVDAGGVFGLRRSAQNAADNASLAAALALCQDEDVEIAGLSSAEDNGFDNNGTSNTVAISNPPTTGLHRSAVDTDADEYVEVLIITTYQPHLIQVINGNPIETRARAVAHCSTEGSASDAQVILDSDDECSLSVSGNGTYNVNGGGMHIDSEDNYALCASGNAHVTADTVVSVVGQVRRTGNATIAPSPSTGDPLFGDPLEDLEPPDNPYPTGTCTTAPASGIISPGKYCGISVSSNNRLIMQPGDYWIGSLSVSSNACLIIGVNSVSGSGCPNVSATSETLLFVDGGNFSVSGNGNLDANLTVIYMEDGNFSVTGNGNISITAPTSGAWQGMMLYMDQENTSTISIQGNGSVSTTGTIYGAASSFNISGNGSNTVLNAQVIVNTMNISGNGTINQNYNASQVFGGGGSNSFVTLAE